MISQIVIAGHGFRVGVGFVIAVSTSVEMSTLGLILGVTAVMERSVMVSRDAVLSKRQTCRYMSGRYDSWTCCKRCD
jgi:hypothetical protein